MKTKFWLFASILTVAAATTFVACNEEFLEPEIPGALTEGALSGPGGIEGAVIGAYSQLSGRASRHGGSYNWVTGAMAGGEANKGTEPGDGNDIDFVVSFNLTPTSAIPAQKWQGLFEGVTRANSAAKLARGSEDPRVTEAFRANMIGQATFLRAHYFFDLYRHFKNVPYFRDTDDPLTYAEIPNTDNIAQIEADFLTAIDLLPETQASAGMVNKTAAKAYLGKVYLYQEKWGEAATILQDVIDNGVTSNNQSLALLPNYSQAFNAEFDNSSESIFAIQASANSGSVNNANYAFDLQHLQGSPVGGCCGFWQPSFDLVNSFRTEGGLPLLDGSYRDAANLIDTDLGVGSSDPHTVDTKPVDPRLDHSVGRRGVPYLDWGPHPGQSWIRSQPYGGPFSPKKFIYYSSQTGTFQDGSSWTSGYTAMNFNIIRFADVLLMAAEAYAENDALETARALVNRVRSRASDPATWVTQPDGSNAANYEISTYDAPWTDKNLALEAIYMERKLELSNEGNRFFDLVRWGRAESFLNDYFAFESQFIPAQFQSASFESNETMYPIPQGQIDLQTGVLSQNPGY